MSDIGTKNKKFIQEVFKQVFETSGVSEKVIAQYFSSNYQQWVDGHKLNYDDFIAHIKAQQSRVARVSIHFKSLVAEGNKVASIHLIDAVTKAGKPVKGRVMAQFTLEDGKITACEELTFIQEASEEDQDLGHTH